MVEVNSKRAVRLGAVGFYLHGLARICIGSGRSEPEAYHITVPNQTRVGGNSEGSLTLSNDRFSLLDVVGPKPATATMELVRLGIDLTCVDEGCACGPKRFKQCSHSK